MMGAFNLPFRLETDGSTSFAGSLKAAGMIIAPDLSYPRPEDYFGSLANVPVGWLQTMVTAGVKKIGLSVNRYPLPGNTPEWNISDDDITIVGSGRPELNSGDTGMIDGTGSIVEGGFQFLLSNRVTLRDLGVDSGNDYSGASPTNGHFIFSQGSRARLYNVSYVGKSNSRALGAHAVLIQGCDDSEVVGLYGAHTYHSCAIKSQHVRLHGLRVRKSIIGITLKSDTVASGTGFRCANIDIRDSEMLDLGDATGGLGISFAIGSTVAAGQDISDVYSSGVKISFPTYNSSRANSGISIGSQVDGGQIDRVVLGGITVKNSTFALDVTSGVDNISVQIPDILVDTASRAILHYGRSGSKSVQIGAAKIYGAVTAVQLNGEAKLNIGTIDMVGGAGTVVSFLATTAQIKIGTWTSSTRPLFDTASTTYLNSCVDFTGDGTTPVRLSMAGGAFVLRGKCAPGSASAATNYGLLTLPEWARPASKRTVFAAAVAGGVAQMLVLDIATNGTVSVKSLPANTTMISLDGVSWEFGL